MMTSRAVLSMLLCAALAGCGGGSWEIRLVDGELTVLFVSDPDGTTSQSTHLSGSAFLPRGASCTFDAAPFASPSCRCNAGPLAVGRWTNSATGANGPLELTVFGSSACVPTHTAWRTPGIALAPGGNLIFLSLSDGDTEGAASITVVRN